MLLKKNVANHYGYKMKVTVDAHPKINRGKKTHADSGKLIGHGPCVEFLNLSSTGSYVYKEKTLILKLKEYMIKMEMNLENDYMNMLKIIYHGLYYHMKNLNKK